MNDVQARVHEWVELVQTPKYQFSNCWRIRLEQFWSTFSPDDVPAQYLMEAAERFPNYIFYQIAAETCAPEPTSRLRFSKRAFWLNSFDHHIQERFFAASYLWGTGRSAEPPDRTLPFTCSRPFETLEIGGGGGVHSCCSGWLPEVSGWLQTQSLQDIWQGDITKRHQSAIAAGDYSACSALLCPYFHDKARQVPRGFSLYEPLDPTRSTGEASPYPSTLHLCNDASCSLHCPSCRTKTIVADRERLNRFASFDMPKIMEVLPELKRIWITGSGDPFASKHYRELLSLLKAPDLRHIKIDMQTNGVLFDEREWARFDFSGRLGVVIVSIDAGTAQTYSDVRKGGNWERLLKNMEFLGRRRAAGEIDHLRLDAVIQACNFREIPQIVALTEQLGFDQCYFSILTNWGHLSWETFSSAFVFSSDHPDYEAFCAIYDEFRTSDTVDWGNLPRWTTARP